MNIAIVVDMQKGFNPTREAVQNTRSFLQRAKLTTYLTAMPTGGGPIRNQNGWAGLSEEGSTLVDAVADLPHRTLYKDGYSAAEAVQAVALPGEAILMGGDTDGCLLATAFGLVDKGWKVRVLSDCCFSSGGGSVNALGLAVLRRSLGPSSVLSSGDMLRRL